MTFRALSFALPLLFAAGPAAAHHVMGGALPASFMEGLLSGLGHPVIGLDHLAFTVAVGLVAAFMRRGWMAPLAAVAGSAAGCLLALGAVMLPMVEAVVAASVLLLGAVALFGRRLPPAAALPLFALAGLFHGAAYGGAIVGAETTPLTAYLLGFSAIQMAIALGVVALARGVWRASSAMAVQPRLAGAVCAGVGLVFAVEALEGALLA